MFQTISKEAGSINLHLPDTKIKQNHYQKTLRHTNPFIDTRIVLVQLKSTVEFGCTHDRNNTDIGKDD